MQLETNYWNLTRGQSEIWFDQQIHKRTPLYNIGGYVYIKSPVNIAALEQALRLTVSENSSLRTRIHLRDAIAQQQFPEHVSGLIEHVDLTTYSHEKVMLRMQEEFVRPFELCGNSLARFILLKGHDQSIYWFMVFHHLVMDGRGIATVIQRAAQYYNAQLSENTIDAYNGAHYSELVKSDEDYMSSDKCERNRVYWRKKYFHIPEATFPQISGQDVSEEIFTGRRAQMTVPRSFYNHLSGIGRKNTGTFYQVFIAALYTYITRTQNRNDLIIGLPTSHYNSARFRATTGYSTGILPAWFDFGCNLSFSQLLKKIATSLRSDYRHQRLPVSEINRAVGFSGSSRSQMFDITLSYESWELNTHFGDSPAEIVTLTNCCLQTPLAISIREYNEEKDVTITFDYNLNYLTEDDVSGLINRINCCLKNVAADPDALLTTLAFLPEEELNILQRFNQSDQNTKQTHLLHHYFEQQAQRIESETAITSLGGNTTYAELDMKANRLAHHLCTLGVGPDMRVGIALPRNETMIIAMLGVLKAGGAYVPLDLAYPQNRIAYMLDDAQVNTVLVGSDYSIPGDMRNIVDLRYLDTSFYADTASQDICLSPENMAYIIYTSGSTGKPKGVVISHRAATGLIDWSRDVFDNNCLKGVLASTSICFDLSVFEIFVPLSRGGTVMLVENALELSSIVYRDKVTLINTVPSAMAALLETGAIPASIRVVNLAGEALRGSLVQKIYRSTRVENVYNLYGPSEDTTYSTYALCQRDDKNEPDIGRPINNTKVYVVDSFCNLQPLGTPGELILAGNGLSRGYLNRATLTASSFIPDPFSGIPGALMYKTGDSVRYRKDGTLVYLGRLDHQVKVRGFRIELGEIETQLLSEPAVAMGCVLACNEREDVYLAAYIQCELQQNQQQLIEQIKVSLGEKLPAYMIPAAWVVMDKLPLTPNGKIDRKALPAPEKNPLQQQLVAAKSDQEKTMLSIWQQVLMVETLGMNSDFFALGGHSLLAVSLLARVRDQFITELPFKTIFHHSTPQALLSQVLKAGGVLSAQSKPVRLVSRKSEMPLSYGQQRLWFLDRLGGADDAYNMPIELSLSGKLNRDALQQALQTLIDRHEILRTGFVSRTGRVVQVIADNVVLPLQFLDLEKRASAEHTALTLVQEFAAREAATCFNLEQPPLVRASLARLNENEHRLFLTLHHIVSDGWSIGILGEELGTLYNAYLKGEKSPLPQLTLQYADCAAWQQETLDDQYLAPQLDFWRKYLDGTPALLELPMDHPRPQIQTYSGAIKHFHINAELTDQLAELAVANQCTLYMVLVSAYFALLSRYSHSYDLVVGTPVANRQLSELENVAGFFVNTLALRVSLDDNPDFSQILQRVRLACMDIFSRQDMPFERLVEALQPQRNLDHSPIFQVMFILQKFPLERLQFDGLTTGLIPREHVAAKFDLTLTLNETNDTLAGEWEYNRDLFDPESIERMSEHYLILLKRMVQEPAQKFESAALLTADEQHLLLHTYNQTNKPKFLRLLGDGIYQHASTYPDDTALVSEHVRLSYSNLVRRVNTVAAYLQQIDVGPDCVVGVCLSRSPDMLISILAILKAGGAYLPLDPTYPLERLTFMLNDAKCNRVLVNEQTRMLYAADVNLLTIDVANIDTNNKSHSVTPVQVVPENLAYIIYTSGSTGRPKGVMITHRSACALLDWAKSQFPAAWTKGVLAATSICFDLSVFELFLPLHTGGSVLLAQNALALSELSCRDEVTLINTVPSAMTELIEMGAVPDSVKVVNLAGEPLHAALADKIFEHTSVSHLFNLYGPSEDTTYSTWARVSPSSNINPGIGRPIDNTHAYLLDKNLQPTPLGVPGELYLGGSGLARGYFDRPELTAENFVPDPFSNIVGATLYRTGDLVRYRNSGELQFLGRLDHQVKLRGFRIELGEIESTIMRHSHVHLAAVCVHQSDKDVNFLVAYVQPDHSVSEQSLRSDLEEILRADLPAYMVPDVWMFLRTMPLLANGKTNRKKLPAPELESTGHVHVPPDGPNEQMMISLWEQILGVSKIGMHDNFFQLGGHSLLGARLFSRIELSFGVKPPLKLLFESPTPGLLLSNILRLKKGNDFQLVPAIEPVLRNQYLALSFSQERLWFLDKLDHSSSYNMAGALRLKGKLNVEALTNSFNALIERHEVLRTRFEENDGVAAAKIDSSVNMPFDYLDLRNHEKVEDVCRQDLAKEANTPFDLTQSPLIRVRLLQLDEQLHVLALTIHHIISDGWSLGILVDDLSALYTAFARKSTSPLLPQKIQYADFADWQRKWLAGDNIEQQRSYWIDQLSGSPPQLLLPTDYQRPAFQSFRERRLTATIDADLAQDLGQLAERNNSSLYMLLLAVFNLLLARLSGQHDIVVGSPVAGRQRRETEDLIGFFVNTLALRTRLDMDNTFIELLLSVRDSTLEAWRFQEFPFEKIVEALQVPRNLSYTPIFQVFFNMLNLPPLQVCLPGLEATALAVPEVANKFDLTLYISFKEQDRLGLELAYNSELFCEPRMKQFLCQYQALLDNICSRPELPLHVYSLGTAEPQLPDPKQALHRSVRETIPDRLYAIARTMGNCIAIVDENNTWTYTDLLTRTDQVAHTLDASGVGSGDVVAVLGDRSAYMVSCLLGILKTGAAFCIIDPAYPVERNVQCLEQVSQLKLLIGIAKNSQLLVLLKQRLSVIFLTLDDFKQANTRTFVSPIINADSPAYISFTSGTIGTPLGVVTHHRPLIHYLDWVFDTFEFDCSDHFSLLSGLAHDPLMRDIFSPLCLGARLTIPSHESLINATKLACWFDSNAITVAHLSPAMAQLLVNGYNELSKVSESVRYLFFGGDRLGGTDIIQSQKVFSQATLVNYYGATETPQAMGFHVVNRIDQNRESIPLGKGIDQVQLLVLREGKYLASVGELGEIAVRTPYLSIGYLDEQQTSQRFKTNPFNDHSNSYSNQDVDRIYLTGDLGRYLPDGSVVFVARKDQQIKIRGFRIEPAEIETQLCKLLDVDHAVVIARDDLPGGSALVAYVIPELPSDWDPRTQLVGLLPSHMVPGFYVSLKAFPLTANGKIDRAALPPPVLGHQLDQFQPPVTEQEVALALIWKQLLGVDKVGRSDDFFRLGGHSLLATQLSSRIRTSLGIDLSVRDIFKFPTVVSMALSLKQHLPRQQRNSGIISQRDMSLEPVNRSGCLPMSMAQQRFWFLHQVERNPHAYNIVSAYKLTGQLNEDALQAALNKVVERHEVLRTALVERQGVPVQRVLPAMTVELRKSYAVNNDDKEQQVQVTTFIQALQRQAFDLAKPPLMRAALLEINTGVQVLAISVHHAASDGWGVGVLFRDIVTLYQAFSLGQSSPLMPLRIQYGDFSVCQRRWLNENQLDQHLAFWRERLNDLPPSLELPTDRPRQQQSSHTGSAVEFSIPALLVESLDNFASANSASLYMVLLAAFQVLMYRYSGQTDIAVGSPFANRLIDDMEPMVGLFMNTQVMRSNISPDISFQQFLQQVRDDVLAINEHQDIPFEYLAEVLQPERSKHQGIWYQVALVLLNMPDENIHGLPNLKVHRVPVLPVTSKLDLTLYLYQKASTLEGYMEFSADLFDKSTIERLLESYLVVLSEVCRCSEQTLQDMAILTSKEQNKLINHWQGQTTKVSSLAVHEQIAANASLYPNDVALSTFDYAQPLSYVELNNRADQLAEQLFQLGVSLEDKVGVCMKRSPELMIAFLAILKSGACCVPMDPAYPQARLMHMIDDAQPVIVLVRDDEPVSGINGVPIDSTGALLNVAETHFVKKVTVFGFKTALNLEHPAYLIYTSGSTGVPKGVLVSHRSLATFTNTAINAYSIDKHDNVLQFSTIGFDIAIEEIFSTWCAGASLVLRDETVIADVHHLMQRCQQHQISVLDLPSAYWHAMVDEIERGISMPPSLRLVIIGGERANPVKAKIWLKHVGTTVRLVNTYGPTETTVVASMADLNAEAFTGSDEVTIGNAINNVTIYLLDSQMALVPIGVPGEMYIGGAGIARGYHQQAAITARQFVPNPMAQNLYDGTRLYRTGDLARYLSDGRIEYLGRIDQQVKIRGFRVELGEIESTLLTHAQVSQAVVTAIGEKSLRLAAYILPQDAQNPPTLAQLQNCAMQHLPDYMIPQGIKIVKSFVLTTNGKIDFGVLPEPEWQAARSELVAPRNVLETELAQIWCETLELSSVSVTDNFFDLGGHSLLATQIVSRVREQLGKEFPLRLLFESATIESLASFLSNTETQNNLIALSAKNHGDTVPLSFAQQRMWFLDQLEGGEGAYNLPSALRLQGVLNTTALLAAFEQILTRHPVLRARFFELDGKSVQQISSATPFSLQSVDLSQLDSQEVSQEVGRYVAEEALLPFDLSRDTLLRATLLRLAPQHHILMTTMHHIVSDGWSVGILVRELAALYRANLHQTESGLVPLSITYGDYASWQQARLEDGLLERQLNYWRQQLKGAPASLALPTDKTRPSVLRSQGARERIMMDTDLTDSLIHLAKERDATLFMVLVTIYILVLNRYSGDSDICVGTPVANRTHPDIEPLIGFFVNTLVLRLTLQPDMTFYDALQTMRDVSLQAYEHQDIPFERLVEELATERSLNQSPLFQVSFDLQNIPIDDLDLEGINVSAVDRKVVSAQFDLSLSIFEMNGMLRATFEYNTDLFVENTIATMARHFVQLATQVTNVPGSLLSHLDILDEKDRQALIANSNNTAAPIPEINNFVELFDEVAKCQTDAQAIVGREGSYTYGQLAEKVNKRALLLRSRGVGPDQIVAVYLENVQECICTILAIFKTGGAYLLLDAAQALERQALILNNSGARVLVSEKSRFDLFLSFKGQLIDIDDNDNSNNNNVEELKRLTPLPNKQSLAYVIYTSGSTGLPKGVMVSQENLINHAFAVQKCFELTEKDRVLQFAASSFDVMVEEVFPTLLAGGTVVTRDQKIVTDFQCFNQFLSDFSLTVLNLPVAYWHGWFTELDVDIPHSLRLVVVGSDKLYMQQLNQWRQLTDTPLFNGYGLTETTISSSFYRDSAAVSIDGIDVVPIGKPIANVSTYVLDNQMRLQPNLLSGELFIGGVGVARGYLSDAALTAQRFLPDPYSTQPGMRWFKTSDRVLRQADGELVFLGRNDHQVKLRGFRIEPGEIEALLVAHAQVDDALVVLTSIAGTQVLVAYVQESKHKTTALTVEILRVYLTEHLPAYMVPACIVIMPSFPLSSSGKVDRKKLPEPTDSLTTSQTGDLPATPTEQLIADIWKSLLNQSDNQSAELTQVGRTENLFELGVHSLLVTQAISRMRKVFAVEISIQNIFDNPTLKAQAGVIDTLVIDTLNSEVSQQAEHPLPPITRATIQGPAPLSFAQQRLWFLHHLDGPTPAYHIPVGLRIQGQLDRNALERSLALLIERHQILRTAFVQEQGVAHQVIYEIIPTPITFADLSTAGTSEEQIQQILYDSVRQSFDLSTAPLFRVCLLQTSPQEHLLCLTMHHIISDGWSIEVLVREWSHLYTALVNGKPSTLAPLPIQYSDYARWICDWISGDTQASQVAWWKSELDGIPAFLDFPTSKPRPLQQTFEGDVVSFSLGESLSKAMRKSAIAQGVSLFMILLSAYATLLSRYTNQRDIVIGTAIAGRRDDMLESLIGLFTNTLALRLTVNPQHTFEQLLAQARTVTLGAYAHQDVPFEMVVDVLQIERDRSRSPLFQTLFVLQNTRSHAVQLPDLSVEPMSIPSGSSMFDMTLSMEESGADIIGALEYNSHLFDRNTMETLTEQLQTLLEAVMTQTQLPLSHYPILNTRAREYLLNELTPYHVQSIDGLCIHQWFEHQVKCTPNAVALIDGDIQLSYARLNASANRQANYLRHRGVTPGSLVGVCLDRSATMLQTLLAILKCSAAYVAMDPAYPKDRIVSIIEDSGLAFLVSTSNIAQAFSDNDAQLICLDENQGVIETASEFSLPACNTDQHLAYVIYTSGSTGKPKGVAICHRNASAMLQWARSEFSASDLAGVLASTSICFDLSVFELFLPLSVGGSVILAENALHLPTLTARDEVTLINTVPSAMGELLRADQVPTSVRIVNLAGEALTRVLVDQIYALAHVEKVYNLYGPSEDTTYSTYALIEAGSEDNPSIGRAIANSRAMVVDEYLEPVPVGVAGELVLSGEGVVQGYLHRADLTAERFIANPFAELHQAPGSRAYRTGDLVRQLPDGSLDFLGRIDHQVKIRGFRIEPGEVEVALSRYPGIENSVVVVHEPKPGDKRLVAYLQYPAQLQDDSLVSKVQSHLQETLTRVMIPSFFVVLSELPRTNNGKINRKALPEPDYDYSTKAAEQEQFNDPHGQLITGIWKAVLGVENIAPNDNFFEIGGHSLLATQVISRIREMFDIDLPLHVLFEAPTTSALKEKVEQGLNTGSNNLPQVVRASRKQPIALTYAQERLWVQEKLIAEPGAHNMPHGLRIKGNLCLPALHAALEDIKQRHEVLRTTFPEKDGQPTQLIDESAQLVITNVDLSELTIEQRDERVNRLLNQELKQPFNLEKDHPLRVSFIKLADCDHILLWTFHHIAFDGWSAGIFFKELQAFYQARVSGLDDLQNKELLDPLSIQMADLATWQRAYVNEEYLKNQLDYWTEKLKGVPPVLELPLDHARPPVQAAFGRAVSFDVPVDTAQALRELCRQEGATLFMVLYTSLVCLFSRYSGQNDLILGMVNANRNRLEFEKLIGFFVNILPMRTVIGETDSFRDLLCQVRSNAMEAYVHQDLPFEQLVKSMDLPRDLRHTPLVQVIFGLQNAPLEEIDMPEFDLSPVTFEEEPSVFDLTIPIWEQGDGLAGQLRYNSTIFEPQTVVQMSEDFLSLLGTLSNSPDSPVLDIPSTDIDNKTQQEPLFEYDEAQEFNF